MAGIPVMEGNLAEFALADVLGVLGLSRQYTRLELFFRDHSPAGSIFLKSGKVVQAVSGSTMGREAFLELIEAPVASFRVVRVEMPALIPEPIDTVTALLMEAAERADDGPGTTRMDSHEEAAFELRVHPVFRALTEDTHDRATPVAPFPAVTNPQGHGTVKSGMRPIAPSSSCILAVASPKGGVGKTTVALNLALSLTRRGLDVILVDGDINGDVMSAVDSRAVADVGVFDVLLGKGRIEDALRGTAVPNLRIIPSLGAVFPNAAVTVEDNTGAWRDLLTNLGRRAQVVVVDSPAGMFGTTHQILSACTHVIGVLQAEVIAQRSFTMFSRGLEAVDHSVRPVVLGIALNMLQTGSAESVDVMARACADLPSHTLFDTTIPRSPAFLHAAAEGVPVLLDGVEPAAVSFLFDTLASEVLDRLRDTVMDIGVERETSLG
jgi:cellulose biosynthesis protein BcsQ